MCLFTSFNYLFHFSALKNGSKTKRCLNIGVPNSIPFIFTPNSGSRQTVQCIQMKNIPPTIGVRLKIFPVRSDKLKNQMLYRLQITIILTKGTNGKPIGPIFRLRLLMDSFFTENRFERFFQI